MSQGQEFKLQEELLSQTVTAEELPLLLQRLGEEEFHLSNDTSVRDIVEVTNSDPVRIGRALAEIRRQTFDERFVEAFADHERRIHSLEGRKSSPPATTTDSVRAAMRQIALEQAAARDVQERLQRKNGVIILLVGALGMAFWFGLNAITEAIVGPNSVQIKGKNGVTIVKERDGTSYVVRPDGSQRPPNPEETKLVNDEEARVRHR